MYFKTQDVLYICVLRRLCIQCTFMPACPWHIWHLLLLENITEFLLFLSLTAWHSVLDVWSLEDNRTSFKSATLTITVCCCDTGVKSGQPCVDMLLCIFLMSAWASFETLHHSYLDQKMPKRHYVISVGVNNILIKKTIINSAADLQPGVLWQFQCVIVTYLVK